MIIGSIIVLPTGVANIPTDTGLEFVLNVDAEQVTTHLKSVATDTPLVKGYVLVVAPIIGFQVAAPAGELSH
jgi:hypothetical protein